MNQQVLAAMQSRPKPSMPMPSKRTSVMAKSPERDFHLQQLQQQHHQQHHQQHQHQLKKKLQQRKHEHGSDSSSDDDDDDSLCNVNEGGGSSVISTPERERAARLFNLQFFF